MVLTRVTVRQTYVEETQGNNFSRPASRDVKGSRLFGRRQCHANVQRGPATVVNTALAWAAEVESSPTRPIVTAAAVRNSSHDRCASVTEGEDTNSRHEVPDVLSKCQPVLKDLEGLTILRELNGPARVLQLRICWLVLSSREGGNEVPSRIP